MPYVVKHRATGNVFAISEEYFSPDRHIKVGRLKDSESVASYPHHLPLDTENVVVKTRKDQNNGDKALEPRD